MQIEMTSAAYVIRARSPNPAKPSCYFAGYNDRGLKPVTETMWTDTPAKAVRFAADEVAAEVRMLRPAYPSRTVAAVPVEAIR